MKNLKFPKFWRNFFRFLTLGLGVYLLLLVGQVSFLGGYTQRGPQLAFADQNDTPIPDVGGPPMVDQPSVECTTSCPSGKTGSCGGHKYWIWAEQRYGDCQCETEAQTCQAPQPPAAPTCPKDGVVGTTKDDQGCTRNIHTREDCSQYLGGPFACPAAPTSAPTPAPTPVPQPPQQPAPQQQQQEQAGSGQQQQQQSGSGQQQQQQQQVIVQPPAQPAQPAQPQAQLVCPAGTRLVVTSAGFVCMPPTVVPQGGNNNVNQNVNSNSNVITVNAPQPAANTVRFADVALCPEGYSKTVNGNTVTCTAPTPRVVLTAAGVETKELPKTGLPVLAWLAGAFLPIGAGMQRFKRGTRANWANPHYIWEDKQFKV